MLRVICIYRIHKAPLKFSFFLTMFTFWKTLTICRIKEFGFPSVYFVIGDLVSLESQSHFIGITWADLKYGLEHDHKLSANLRKAHKLTLKALNPFNNKHSVPLALAVVDGTTIAAEKLHLPHRKDAASFLTLIKVFNDELQNGLFYQ